MKIKIAIVFLLTLLVSGCTAEYNLYITPTATKEKVEVYLPGYTYSELKEVAIMYEDSTTSGMGDYVISAFENENKKGILVELNNGYNVEASSKFWQRCYENIESNYTGGSLEITTTSHFMCFDQLQGLDQVTINLYIDAKVNKHNADSVQGNKYTWLIKKSNPQKQIIVEAKEIEQNEEIIPSEEEKPDVFEDTKDEGKEIQNNIIIFLIIAAVILVIVVAVILYFVKKNKDINKL